jgi:hypothetical protein
MIFRRPDCARHHQRRLTTYPSGCVMGERETLDPKYTKLDKALRSIGYTFEAAVADVIDNSIDAKAQSVVVRLVLHHDGLLDLVVVDNGGGMSSSTLREAMRFGADVSDEIGRLGKFGLGLKLASLSQAKALYVITHRDGEQCGRAWLEDGITSGFASDILDAADCDAAVAKMLPVYKWGNSGTLVWWTGLYRVGQNHVDPEEHAQRLLERLRNYLALAFHRFLQGRPHRVAIRLEILDAKTGRVGLPFNLEPLDPFGYSVSGHPDFPAELTLDGENADRLHVIAHVWPPNAETPNYRLPGGANSRQGFYFYRNNRLIQGGGWNGIREVEPHSSLARVEVDVGADFDVELSLDVKKVEIQLPPALAKSIQRAKTSVGTDFKKYLAIANNSYRRREVTGAELPFIPSSGLPAELSQFLHNELRIEKTKRHRDLVIEWASLGDDQFFDFDRDEGRLYLNKHYRRQLMHGLPGSSADAPVVKSLLFLLLRGTLLSQRTGSRAREHIEQTNRILVEAVKYERVRE